MAAANVTVIGRAASVRGNVTGEGDLEVQGFVAGDIAVSGDVTVDSQGLVGANVQGRRVVVRGTVRGDVTGEESIVLEDGARVVGDLRAPRVAIGQGALVRGYVQTGDVGVPAGAGRARGQAAETTNAGRAQAPRPAARPAPPAARVVPVAAARPAAPPKPEVAATEAPIQNANHQGPRRPPPPVVPALKKMKGQILKKKER